MFWKILAAAFTFATIVLADESSFVKSSDFDEGLLGELIVEDYKSSDIQGIKPNFIPHLGNCTGDGLYATLSLRGAAIPKPGPVLLDDQGALVWTAKYVEPYNLAVQQYRGKQYLTFWVGDDKVKGHGSGEYFMLNSSYHQVHRFRAGNKLDGDLHEFHITNDDTALITIYQIVRADLRPVGGSSRGWIWEGIFQEIDIETKEVLFEWRASDHVGFDQSYHDIGRGGRSRGTAWDWFHINSVDKDPEGNYLISSRWLNSVTYINGTSGNIIWVLGGKSNMFKDLSDGHATEFASQHHARWRDNYTSITLFDNSDPGPHYPSTGLWLDLDFDAMTVKLRTKYSSDNKITTESQGSFQVLPNGNVLIGYGHTAQYSEFRRDGTLLCSVHYGAASRFGTGGVQSYRVGKFPWVGKPDTLPDIAGNQTSGDIYISWMGATEIEKWTIEEADSQNATDNEYVAVKTVPKKGFETITDNIGTNKSFIRAVAIDKGGEILGRTKAIERGILKSIKHKHESLWINTVIIVLVALAAGGILCLGAVMGGIYLGQQWSKYHSYVKAATEEQELRNAKEFVLDDGSDEEEENQEAERGEMLPHKGKESHEII